jgi:ABC-2 type transport system permease protein
VEELKVADILDTDRGKLAAGLDALDIRVEQKQLFRSTGAIVRQLILAEATRIITPRVVRGNPFISNLMSRILAAREAELEESGRAAGPAPASQTSTPPAEARKDSQGIYEVLVPAYTVMFVFFMVLIMARSFLAERDLGTLRRLRLAPVAPSEILLGKTLPFLLLSLAQSAILFLSGRLIFGMSWGPQPWLLVPIVVCTSLAATSLGLLVATVARTDSQVSAYADFLVITMAAISGVFMPRDWLPWTMQQISLVTPHAWALIAYDELLAREVVSVSVVARCCAAQLGFALVYFLLGWWRFRTMQ